MLDDKGNLITGGVGVLGRKLYTSIQTIVSRYA